MTTFLLNTVAALTLVAQSSVPQPQKPFSRDSIRLAVAPTLLEPQAGAQPDWARVVQLAANDEVTVVTGPTTVSGRLVSADQSGLTLRPGSGGTTRFERASIQEVRRTTRKRGSKVGAAIGAGAAGFLGVGLAIGLATKDCGESCTGEKAGIAASLIGLPVGGGFAGYYLWPRRTSVEVIYTRPML
jgi:hypothetical protein